MNLVVPMLKAGSNSWVLHQGLCEQVRYQVQLAVGSTTEYQHLLAVAFQAPID